MKKILLILITFFACISVNASVDVKIRPSDNYGLDKVIDISEDDIVNTPFVDPSEKVYDFASKLTDLEKITLRNKADKFIKETDIDLVLVTIDKEIDKEEVKEFAHNFYDYNNFGLNTDNYDGIEIIINVNINKPFLYIVSFGDTNFDPLQSILDTVYDDFKNGKYNTGFNNFIDSCTKNYIEEVEKNDSTIVDNFDLGIKKRIEQKDNNYGVNKKEAVLDTYHLGRTPLVDASNKVYDFSGVLSEEEKATLKEKALSFLEETGIELIIVTIDKQYSDSQIEDLADDFFDFNDFGISDKSESYDGILAIRNTNNYNRYYYISTSGTAQMYYDSDRVDDILDDMYDNMHYDHYYDGFIDFINSAKRYYNKGVLPKYKGCHVDSLGDLYDKDGNPVSWEKGVYVLPLIPALLISGLVATIVVCILVAKNKMVKKAVDAKDYLDEDSIKYTAKNDTFISTHTSSYRISSSSGGGGGGSHHSSGGFSHGGGGRHC